MAPLALLVAHSESKLQPKLNQARKVDGVRHEPESSAAKSPVWRPELGMIEEVEEFRPELDVHPLTDTCLFENRKIKVVNALLPQCSINSCFITESPGWRPSETCRVEPAAQPGNSAS